MESQGAYQLAKGVWLSKALVTRSKMYNMYLYICYAKRARQKIVYKAIIYSYLLCLIGLPVLLHLALTSGGKCIASIADVIEPSY